MYYLILVKYYDEKYFSLTTNLNSPYQEYLRVIQYFLEV